MDCKAKRTRPRFRMHQVAFRLDRLTLERLDRFAQEEELSRSAVIRLAILKLRKRALAR